MGAVRRRGAGARRVQDGRTAARTRRTHARTGAKRHGCHATARGIRHATARAAERAGRRAAHRTAFALRQSTVLRRVRQALPRALRLERLCGTRRRLMVRTRLPRRTHVHRRTVRHVWDDCGTQDTALAGVCPRHEPPKRAQLCRTHQRPRTLRFQSHHRLVVDRRGQARHAAKRYGDRRSARTRPRRAATAPRADARRRPRDTRLG